MLEISVDQALQFELDRLPESKKSEVLEFVRSIDKRDEVGVPGKSYFPLDDQISSEDLEIMSKTIEEGCENIDPDGW